MPTRRPVFLYSLLAALFAITLLYQVRYLPDVVRSQRITRLSSLSMRGATGSHLPPLKPSLMESTPGTDCSQSMESPLPAVVCWATPEQ